MIRALAALVLLSGPALAQDADPSNQIVEGILACVSGNGDVAMTEAVLDAAQWTRSDDGEEGLTYFFPGAGDASYVYIADDGSFCHVESTTVGSEATSQILAAILEAPEGVPFFYSKDDMGCTRLDLETGVTATIQSGGNDPVCASDTDSAVRFDFTAAE